MSGNHNLLKDCEEELTGHNDIAADNVYFRGRFSSRFETKAEMPCKMIRLTLAKRLFPMFQIAEVTIELPDAVSDGLWKRTDYTWP